MSEHLSECNRRFERSGRGDCICPYLRAHGAAVLGKARENRSDLERTLMKDHGCLHYNGPGGGACKTCKRRAGVVLAWLDEVLEA